MTCCHEFYNVEPKCFRLQTIILLKLQLMPVCYYFCDSLSSSPLHIKPDQVCPAACKGANWNSSML